MMRTNILYVMALAASIFVVSCNSESDIISSEIAVEDDGVEMVRISDDGNSFEAIAPGTVSLRSGTLDDNIALKFKDGEALKKALNSLNESDNAGGFAFLKVKNMRKFKSLADIFDEAMEEAESYYDREGGYEEFKAKYSSLYFPEYGDDYSAYLPVSDKKLAKLLNANGSIVIGNEVKKMTDVNSYGQLQRLGLAMPNPDGVVRANVSQNLYSGTNSIDEVMNDKKDRKIWVKTYYRYRSYRHSQYWPHLWIEVCFRKKGFLNKWYNYKSRTAIRGTVSGLFSRVDDHKHENSSHDYVYPMRTYKSPFNGAPYSDYVSGAITIEYQGMTQNLTLYVDYPDRFWLNN